VNLKSISVVVPIFNAQNFIGRCLRSLLKQNFDTNSYEIILVDDGSTDESAKFVEQFISPYASNLRLLRHDFNKGLPSALNTAIRASEGKYIVRVDADDYVSEYFLSTLYVFIQHNKNYGAVAYDYYVVDEKEEVVEHCFSKEKPIGCGVIFKKELMLEQGLYNEEFLLNEEKEFMMRFQKTHSVLNISVPLYRYRRHLNNITNNKDALEFFDKKLGK